MSNAVTAALLACHLTFGNPRRRIGPYKTLGQRGSEVDILDLDTALERFSGFDTRKSGIAELRFFGGLLLQQTADLLGVSVARVERDRQAARAWLDAALNGTHSRDPRPLARRH